MSIERIRRELVDAPPAPLDRMVWGQHRPLSPSCAAILRANGFTSEADARLAYETTMAAATAEYRAELAADPAQSPFRGPAQRRKDARWALAQQALLAADPGYHGAL